MLSCLAKITVGTLTFSFFSRDCGLGGVTVGETVFRDLGVALGEAASRIMSETDLRGMDPDETRVVMRCGREGDGVFVGG